MNVAVIPSTQQLHESLDQSPLDSTVLRASVTPRSLEFFANQWRSTVEITKSPSNKLSKEMVDVKNTRKVQFSVHEDGDSRTHCQVHEYSAATKEESALLWWSNDEIDRIRTECRRIVSSLSFDRTYVGAIRMLLKSYKRRVTHDDVVECYEVLAECSAGRGLEAHVASDTMQLGQQHIIRTLEVAGKSSDADELSALAARSSRAHVALAVALGEFDAREAAVARLF